MSDPTNPTYNNEPANMHEAVPFPDAALPIGTEKAMESEIQARAQSEEMIAGNPAAVEAVTTSLQLEGVEPPRDHEEPARDVSSHFVSI